MTIAFIINHLWQSTCFVLLAALLAFVLRKNSPKIRYWVWLSASLKFLIPFALLVSLGSAVPRPVRNPLFGPAPVFPNTLIQIAEPFSPTPDATVPAPAALRWVPVAIGVLWVLGFLAITLGRCRDWLGVRAALRAGTPIELPIPVPALITPGAEEPGIVGFLRPVLVLPAQLLEHLNSRQLGAILTHELCHVRRRDNFFAAIHMVVEAIFWFNPIVWWVGSRMVEERELACDEEVLRMGCEATDYVEGILKVCRCYTESPLPCISGVTGADVKKRLLTILAGSIAHELNGGKKVALATVGLAALAMPVLIGMVSVPAIRAQNAPVPRPKFEVASIKPCTAETQVPNHPEIRPWANSSPGRLSTGCVRLLDVNGIGLIQTAYDPMAPIKGGPSWMRSAFYEINAKAEGTPSVKVMMGPMLQVLLEDRFQLKVHRETSEGPVYFLSVARGGPKLRPFTEGSCIRYSAFETSPLQPGQAYCRIQISVVNASAEVQGGTLDQFSGLLSLILDHPVINKTGIAGNFDFRVEFAREGTKLAAVPVIQPNGGLSSASDPTGRSSIFTVVHDQLGLRLEPGKGPVEALIIDHLERPTEN